MMKFAFISRHQPTNEQVDLAAEQGIELVLVGDMDAFDPELVTKVTEMGEFDGVIVVHPFAALVLAEMYTIGVFENQSRAAEGHRPQFYAKALHLSSQHKS